jgi:hypothetical protein
VPVDLSLVGVGSGLPGGEFGVQAIQVSDAAIEALAGQGGEFDLGDIEPGSVLGRVVYLESLGQGVNRPGSGRDSLLGQATRLTRSPNSYRASYSTGGLPPQAP